MISVFLRATVAGVFIVWALMACSSNLEQNGSIKVELFLPSEASVDSMVNAVLTVTNQSDNEINYRIGQTNVIDFQSESNGNDDWILVLFGGVNTIWPVTLAAGEQHMHNDTWDLTGTLHTGEYDVTGSVYASLPQFNEPQRVNSEPVRIAIR